MKEVQDMKEKNWWNKPHKIKNFCSSKDTVKKMKQQVTKWEAIVQNA